MSISSLLVRVAIFSIEDWNPLVLKVAIEWWLLGRPIGAMLPIDSRRCAAMLQLVMVLRTELPPPF